MASDPLIAALKAQWTDQPAKPQYQVGRAVDNDDSLHLGVDRVVTPDHPYGLECARTGLAGTRLYLIALRREMAVWTVGNLGALLTDDEWDRACEMREDAVEEAADEA